MNKINTTKKDCSLQIQTDKVCNSNKTMEIFQVEREYTYQVHDDYRDYGYDTRTDVEHLGYFSSATEAFNFIKSRVEGHYGNFRDYHISLIEIDSLNIRITNEEQDTFNRWEQWNKKDGGDAK